MKTRNVPMVPNYPFKRFPPIGWRRHISLLGWDKLEIIGPSLIGIMRAVPYAVYYELWSRELGAMEGDVTRYPPRMAASFSILLSDSFAHEMLGVARTFETPIPGGRPVFDAIPPVELSFLGPWAVSDAVAHAGSRSLWFYIHEGFNTYDASANGDVGRARFVGADGRGYEVVPGITYTFACELLAHDFLGSAEILLRLEWFDENGVALSSDASVGMQPDPLTPVWQALTPLAAVAPADAAFVKAYVEVAFPSQATDDWFSFYFDDVSLTAAYPPLVYNSYYAYRAVYANGTFSEFSEWLQPRMIAPDAPTWIDLQVIGGQLIGSFNIVLHAVRYQLWKRLSGDDPLDAVLVDDSIATNFVLPYGVPGQLELLGDNREFELGDFTDWTGTTGTFGFNITQAFNYGAGAGYSMAGRAISMANNSMATDPVAVVEGETYRATFRWRRQSTNTGSWLAYVDYYDAGSVLLSSSSITIVGTGLNVWNEETLEEEAPADAAFAAIRIFQYAQSPGKPFVVYYDGFSLLHITVPTFPIYALKALDEYGTQSAFSTWFDPPITAFTVYDPADSMRQVGHSVALVTSGAPRTLSYPDASGTIALTANSDGRISRLDGLASYANNAAAVAAGLLVGDLYLETGTDPRRVCIVYL